MAKPDDLQKWMTEENLHQVELLGACWVTPDQIDRALVSERRATIERCAYMADAMHALDLERGAYTEGVYWCADQIADAIRNMGDEG